MSDINDPNTDQLKITYRYAKDHEWRSLLYETKAQYPFNKDPKGLFYIDFQQGQDVGQTSLVYGMVEINEHATIENIVHFLRCLLSLSIVFRTDIQKTIPDEWPPEVIAQFRHQTEEHLWIKVRIL